MDPTQLLYAKTHEWIFVEDAEGGKLGTIGISDFAIEALKNAGAELVTGGELATRTVLITRCGARRRGFHGPA